MFGEESIYGSKIVKIDNKGRIGIPAFTYAEQNDRIVLVRENEYDKDLYLYSEDTFENLLNEKLDKLDFNKKIILYQFLKKEFLKVERKFIISDVNRRITLGEIIDDDVEQIKVIGERNRVRLVPIK